jgi:ankyrin repeat protein
MLMPRAAYGEMCLKQPFRGNQEIVRYLVEKGANVNARVRFLGYPLEVAISTGNLEKFVTWLKGPISMSR